MSTQLAGDHSTGTTAPDLPGFGRDDRLPPASLIEMADLVAALDDGGGRARGRP